MQHWSIGRYEVLRELGSGALGSVSLVRDLVRDGRLLALKRFHRDSLSPEAIADLRRHFLLLRQVRHPNVARVQDVAFDQLENTFVVISDYVEGVNIVSALKGQGAEAIVAVAAQLLRALAHLHSRGLLHHNLKPSNILVTEMESGLRVRLFDFAPGRMHVASLPGARETRLYTAPERLQGLAGDARSDLYSVGVILDEILPGRGAEESGLGALRRIVGRLRANDPDQRFPSATEAWQALAQETGTRVAVEDLAAGEGLLIAGRFVGRERELRQLEEVSERVLHGEGGGLVLVEGEAGMGKTRLLEELRVIAQLSGILSVTASCHPESMGPLAPVRDLLRQVVMSLEPEHPALLGHAPVLSEILPGLPGSDRTIPRLPPDQHWLRIQTAFAALLEEVGETRPILMILDEFQWIDESSLSLLDTFARGVASSSSILVGAFTRSLIEQDGTAPSLVPVIGAEGREVIRLRALRPKAVRELVGSVLTGSADVEEISGVVTRLTNGVPLYVEECLRSLLQGEAVSAASLSGTVQDASGEVAAPEEVARLLKSRLRRLPEPAFDLLKALSIFERPVAVTLAMEVADLDERVVDEAIGLLEKRGLIWTSHFADGIRLELTNAIVRESVAARIEHLEGVVFHDRAVCALEAIMQAGATIRSAELAYHALRTTNVRRALDYVISAAREATELHAYDQSRRFWWTALEKAQELDDQKTVEEILLALAETQERLGDLDGAMDSLGRLRERDRDNIAVLVRIGDLHRLQGRYDQAEATLLRARALAGGRDDPLLQCRVERAIANCLYRRGRYREALGSLESAALLLERNDDRIELARTYTTIGLIHWYHGDLERALKSHTQGLALYLAMRDHVGVATSHVNIGLVLWNRGQLRDALKRYCRAERIARRVGHYLILAVAMHNRGIIEFELGDLDAARSTLAASLQMRRRLADQAGQAKAMDTLGLVHLHAGRYREALRLIDDSISRRDLLGDRQGRANSRVNLGLAHLELWDLDSARDLLRKAARAAEELGTRSVQGEALIGLGEVALRQGRVKEGYVHARRAVRIFRELGQEPDIAQAELLLVRLSLARGSRGLVRQRLARALRRLRRTGTAMLVTQGRYLCGRIRGPDGGLFSLHAALHRAERHGFRELVWRIRLLMGLIHWRMGERAEAANMFRSGMETLRELTRELPPGHDQRFLADPRKLRLRRMFARVVDLLDVESP